MPDMDTLLLEIPGAVALEYRGNTYTGPKRRELLERLTAEERAEVVCKRANGTTFSLAQFDANTGDQAVRIDDDGKVFI